MPDLTKITETQTAPEEVQPPRSAPPPSRKKPAGQGRKKLIKRLIALGVAAAILGCVVNPEVILLGGGVSAAGRALLDPVEDAFQKNVFPPCRDVRFALAQLGNNAGIFGGAALFFTQST